MRALASCFVLALASVAHGQASPPANWTVAFDFDGDGKADRVVTTFTGGGIAVIACRSS